jgi:glycosyltransferase involved in cell wall biosynthesis
MVIGFDGSRAFIKDRTGTENYSYQLLRALSEIDSNNTYIVYVRPGFIKKEEWPENFHFSILNFQRLWTQVGLAKATFSESLDVLFVPAHTLPIIHKPGLKTVMTVHDLGAEYLPKMHQLKQQLYLKYITHYQLRSSSKLIAVSQATKDDLVEKVGIDPKRIEVVYEGFNKDLINKIDIKGNSKEQYYLFVGTIQPRKNLERIIEAFSRQTSVFSLLIVGGKGWLLDEIYKLPKKLDIEERVKFLGRVPDEKLASLYKNAEALLFPSLFEGFGLPILEAQSLGCPVITSNLSSMPEVAGKGAILVDPYDIDDIVKGMMRLQAVGSRQQLIKKGFENIKRFSWEKAAKETLMVLEAI